MLNRTYAAVKKFLEDNPEEALAVAQEMNNYDGNFEWCDTYDWEWLCESAAEAGAEAVDDLVRAAVYGDTYGGIVRYNGYGNLVSGEHEDLLADATDYVTDIMEGLENYIGEYGDVGCINVSDELQEVIDNSLIMKYNVKVTDIVYDIDEEDVYSNYPKASLMADDEFQKAVDQINSELPKELTLTIECDEEEFYDDLVADAISEESGWCVISYNYSIIEDEEEEN